MEKGTLVNDKGVPIVAFGNAMFGLTMKGKLPATLMRLRKKLLEADRDEKLVLIFIDEYLTSQVCSNCKKRGLENISVEEAGKIHALLACPSCKKVWNRDVNSARSIYSITKHMNGNDGERPEEFKRPEAAPPPSTATTIIQTSA